MRPNHVRLPLLIIPIVLLVAFFAHAEEKKPATKDWSKATAFKVLPTIDGDTIEIE